MENKHTAGDLAQMQSLPLDAKIKMTQRRIREWYEYFYGEVYVSFSGGKDSTVLLDIVRKMYPDVPAVFCDTGLEYPEIRKFVKTVENVEWLTPIKWDPHKREYARTNFKEVVKTYGYPVVSKEVSNTVRYAHTCERCMKKLNGTLSDRDGNKSLFNCAKWKFLLDAPFKISSSCCAVMKKRPFHNFDKETGLKPILATMTDEAIARKNSWLKYGCNAFEKNGRALSRPMSFWTEQDVLEYIRITGIPYCHVYGDIVRDGEKLKTTGCDRTGCMFCMYGVHRDKSPNRFQRMKETHPKQYAYCMKPVSEGGLGLDEVLTFIGVEH